MVIPSGAIASRVLTRQAIFPSDAIMISPLQFPLRAGIAFSSEDFRSVLFDVQKCASSIQFHDYPYSKIA